MERRTPFMDEYEVTFILQPDLDEEGRASQLEALAAVVSGNGGQITHTRAWGLRKLAYPIRKKRTGAYYTLRLAMPRTRVQEVERWLRLNENVLRFLIVRAEEVPALPT